jgi:hypothetical protein
MTFGVSTMVAAATVASAPLAFARNRRRPVIAPPFHIETASAWNFVKDARDLTSRTVARVGLLSTAGRLVPARGGVRVDRVIA